ncbi:hypothetical protein [Roseisalinus antarcticus]|uniref:Uncharacterized protein n=1 Tax=Roseisalinus antarcticus TaxID=254357 RepID=A0A1Y5RWN1_9RHOB|nr:hypothetical protein [Roseisalinus antarcticus]SLN26906.1 hypothetical protein ROA7023_00842 [Roseisalinus antarcticus]
MKNRTKVIDRIRSEADRTGVSLPWERGARRAAMIARRRATGLGTVRIRDLARTAQGLNA